MNNIEWAIREQVNHDLKEFVDNLFYKKEQECSKCNSFAPHFSPFTCPYERND